MRPEGARVIPETNPREAAVTTTEDGTNDAGGTVSVEGIDMKLEVVVIPVSDVDRAKEFYGRLGWRLDATPPGVVQFTPHGSGCSVQFGPTLTSAAPGSAKEYLVVSDIVAAREALVAAGVEVGEFVHIGAEGLVSGLDPERRTYRSRASFSDPDGNTWLLQEITTRLPGRVEAAATSFGTASDLASAMRRAAVAHGEHEKRIGEADPNWPDWYAEYMVSEQTGAEPPE
jgi:catechol 2,3-dioxygenase-like lactoylglutathione lyase family enzyme